MGYDPMEDDVRKLLALLKKILKNHPQGSDQMAKFLDQKGFNLNLSFLTFMPMTPEAMAEFEEAYEEFMHRGEESGSRREESKIEFKLNTEDLDFLKKNGIRF